MEASVAKSLSPATPEQNLDRLAELRNELLLLEQETRIAVEAAIPADVAERIQAIEAEAQTERDALQQKVGMLEEWIKEQVLAQACSAKGRSIQAVWMKGRVSWDTKALDGYSKADPRILAFKKEGSPTVSFRAVERK